VPMGFGSSRRILETMVCQYFDSLTNMQGSGYVQLQEAQQLISFVDSLAPALPVIITGDFNSQPSSSAIQLLKQHFVDAWDHCGSDQGLTFDSEDPSERIDYVFLREANCIDANVVPSQVSDHRPIVVDVAV
jgi:endonuclease/exonuclease/phosphatase (EEP) superfamily protein YafD